MVWLAGETQVSVRSARDQVRLAETLAAAPVVAEKMASGGLSVDNARLLDAVVGEPGFAGDAELLLEIAAMVGVDGRDVIGHLVGPRHTI